MKLKKNICRIYNRFVCEIPFILVCYLNINTAQAQDWVPPIGEINVFISNDTTTAAKNYNLLAFRPQRDSIVKARLLEDWTDTIPYTVSPPKRWVCHNFERQLIINSHSFGDSIYAGDALLFNGYKGNNLDSILIFKGTLIDIGKLGLPMCGVYLYDPVTLPQGHGMNAILAGNDATKLNDWNIIEPNNDEMNIPPEVIRNNLETFGISYSYMFKNEVSDKNLSNIMLLEFEIKNGIGTLTYNINDDPRYVDPSLRDNYCHFITIRDTAHPKLYITTTSNMINWDIVEDNLKYAWYSTDKGLTKIPIAQNGGLGLSYLDLPNGEHIILFGAEDYFNLASIDSINVNIETTNSYNVTSLDELTIYPNPIKRDLHILNESTSAVDVYIEIYSLYGSLQHNTLVNAFDKEIVIDLSNLKPSVYLMKSSIGHKVYINKLVKVN